MGRIEQEQTANIAPAKEAMPMATHLLAPGPKNLSMLSRSNKVAIAPEIRKAGRIPSRRCKGLR